MTSLVRVWISGSFVDTFIYRTQLYVVTLHGELRVYQVADVERRLAADFGGQGHAVAYMMFHSKGLGASEEQGSAGRTYSRYMEPDRQRELRLEGDAIPYRSYDLGRSGHSVLDMLIYCDRLFLATEEGLFAAEAEPRQESLKLENRLGFPCLSAKASFGAVAASCGEDGLNVLLNELSWLGPSRSTRKLASVSIRSAYASLGLVNYQSRTDFSVFDGATSLETVPSRQGFVEFSPTATSAVDLKARVAEILGSDGNQDLDYAGNVGSTFVAAGGGKIATVAIRRDSASGRRSFLNPHLRGTYENVLVNVQILDADLLIETQESVIVLPDGEEALAAYEGAATSVRVFPRSKRYLALATVVAREGLMLMVSPSALARRVATEEG
jgi:hypothetical protein